MSPSFIGEHRHTFKAMTMLQLSTEISRSFSSSYRPYNRYSGTVYTVELLQNELLEITNGYLYSHNSRILMKNNGTLL